MTNKIKLRKCKDLVIRLCAERLRPAPQTPLREAALPPSVAEGSLASQRQLEGHSWLFKTVSTKQNTCTPRTAVKKHALFAPTSIERKENAGEEGRNRREGPCSRVAFPALGEESIELLRPTSSVLAELFSPLKLDPAPEPSFRSENKIAPRCPVLLFSAQTGKPGAPQPKF